MEGQRGRVLQFPQRNARTLPPLPVLPATKAETQRAAVKALLKDRTLKRSSAIMLASVLGIAGVTAFLHWELTTSGLEATWVGSILPRLTYRVMPGASPRIQFPADGPYDQELGYTRLPEFMKRLDAAGWEIESQARLSPLHDKLISKGFFPLYQEKNTHGLRIEGAGSGVVSAEVFPKTRYAKLDQVPELVVKSLVFIEDRQVLDDAKATTLNPAVSWERLSKATLEALLDKVLSSRNVPGGSTLATQLEKFRHSPDGRTKSGGDKLQQMASATVRAYLLGRDTRAVREEIVLDYINEVPLGAIPGGGAVTGLGEGVRAWYGADLAAIDAALFKEPAEDDVAGRHAKALAFKRVLSLFLSQRRPAFYLQKDQGALEVLAGTYIRLMKNQGVIPAQLANDALAQDLTMLPASLERAADLPTASYIDRKAANAVRFELRQLLGVKSLYELDRYDLDVKSTFNATLQEKSSEFFSRLRTPEGAVKAGLVGERMLRPDQAATVNYSFTLMERQDDRSVVRVQADTVDSPFDLNRGGKMELGSTAKLRTLLTYLALVDDFHQKWSGQTLDAAAAGADDDLSQWAFDFLRKNPAATKTEMLQAAIDRPFSASPWEGFRTGGGVLHFQNFNKDDNDRRLSVQQAIQVSNNLVFVRVMREIVQHVISTRIEGSAEILKNPEHPARRAYIEQFADAESAGFLRRFYREFAPMTPDERVESLVGARNLTTTRLAAILLSLEPEMDYARFRLRMTTVFPELVEVAIDRYFKTIHPSKMPLHDRAYVARVHPIALWLTSYLAQNPDATIGQALVDSKDARRDSYTWLLDKAGPKRQERDIRTMLEREAFSRHILPYWKKQGFPFEQMTPSYASALGSSGDKPAALAELMGAIVNYGVRVPTKRIDEIRFAKGTPFETTFVPVGLGAVRVVSPEVAEVAKGAVLSVVEHGTAVRLKGALKRADGTAVPIMAKTGTGDNRLETFGPGARLISSDAKSRTATLVFAIGDHFYGTVTAMVDAGAAGKVDDFSFTSSLVVQALRALLPTLQKTILEAEDPWGHALAE